MPGPCAVRINASPIGIKIQCSGKTIDGIDPLVVALGDYGLSHLV
jgi:hypothetical protein